MWLIRDIHQERQQNGLVDGGDGSSIQAQELIQVLNQNGVNGNTANFQGLDLSAFTRAAVHVVNGPRESMNTMETDKHAKNGEKFRLKDHTVVLHSCTV